MTDIGNGMVSGRDKVFKLDQTLKLTAKEKKKIIKVIKAFSMKNTRSTDILTTYC